MNLLDMRVGQRVRLIHEVNLFSDDICPAGLLGTVTWVVDPYGTESTCALVHLDEPCSDLAEWGNVLQVYDDRNMPVTPADFEGVA